MSKNNHEDEAGTVEDWNVPDNIIMNSQYQMDQMAAKLAQFDKHIIEQLPKELDKLQFTDTHIVSVQNKAKTSAIHFCSPKLDTYFPEIQPKARRLKLSGKFGSVPFKILRCYYSFNSPLNPSNLYVLGVWWWYGRDKLAIEYRKMMYRVRAQKFVAGGCTGLNKDMLKYIQDNLKEIQYLLEIPVHAETGQPTEAATPEQLQALKDLPIVKVKFLDKQIGLIQNDVTFTEINDEKTE